jgi:hypothetical protein
MGIPFNLHSGAALDAMMSGIAQTAQTLVRKAFHGYSPDIVAPALSQAASLVANHPLNNLATAPRDAEPAMRNFKTSVSFSSTNWTGGRDFEGFTKPSVNVGLEISDSKYRPAEKSAEDTVCRPGTEPGPPGCPCHLERTLRTERTDRFPDCAAGRLHSPGNERAGSSGRGFPQPLSRSRLRKIGTGPRSPAAQQPSDVRAPRAVSPSAPAPLNRLYCPHGQNSCYLRWRYGRR